MGIVEVIRHNHWRISRVSAAQLDVTPTSWSEKERHRRVAIVIEDILEQPSEEIVAEATTSFCVETTIGVVCR